MCCGELFCLPLLVCVPLIYVPSVDPPWPFITCVSPPLPPNNTHNPPPARTTRSSKSARRTPTTLATSTSASSASAVSSRGASPTGRRPKSSVPEVPSGRLGCSTLDPCTATPVSSTCSLFFQSGSSFDSACCWFSGFARSLPRVTLFAAPRGGRLNASRDSHRRWPRREAEMWARSSPTSPR